MYLKSVISVNSVDVIFYNNCVKGDHSFHFTAVIRSDRCMYLLNISTTYTLSSSYLLIWLYLTLSPFVH